MCGIGNFGAPNNYANTWFDFFPVQELIAINQIQLSQKKIQHFHFQYHSADISHKNICIFRKSLSSAFFLYLALLEAKDRNELHLERFGPRQQNGERVSFHSTLLEYMGKVEKRRAQEVYPHDICTSACKIRGCSKLFVADGCWKLHYPICMFTSRPTSKGLDQFVPHICTKSPKPAHAFCEEHCVVIQEKGIPTGLRSFIKSCGADPVNYTKEEKKKVESKLKQLCANDVSNTCVPEAQGTTKLYGELQV